MNRIFLAVLALTASHALAQSGFPPPPPKTSPVAGVIDLHVHSHPDVFGRNLDDIEVAQLAKARGLRGILLKNHVAETASRAALVMKVVPGIEVWGGVVLNRAVGGINPDAVEWMHRTYGGRGKVVWLPTFEADKHVKTLSRPDARGLVVAPGGQVTPETEAVVRQKVADGRFTSAAEVVEAAVRLLDERDRLEYLRALLRETEQQVQEGKTVEWSPELHRQWRREAQDRIRQGMITPDPDVWP